jgi:hypothetical protein
VVKYFPITILLKILYIESVSVAQPELFDRWANFAWVRKNRWAKWAGFLLMGQRKY